MRACIGLIKRNILVYIKDRQTVFFSILTPLIVFVLYVLFLRGTFVNGLNTALSDAKSMIDTKDVETFANLILLAGVISSSVITVSYSTLTTIVRDRETKIEYDVSATPISRVVVILSYIVAGFLNSFLVSASLLTGALAVVSILGKTYISIGKVFLLYGITALGALSATSFLMIFVMLFKSSSTAGAFQGLLCAATGFVIGAYIPISEFSDSIQTIANLFPGSHIAALFRTTLLSGLLDHMDLCMQGLDQHMVKNSLEEVFSLKLMMFSNMIPTRMNYVYVLGVLLASIFFVAVVYRKIYKRR